MGAWEIPGGSNLTPPPPSPPTGYMIASLVLAAVGGVLFVSSLFPCMGWVNWFAVPINAAAALIGILGLVSGPKRPDGTLAYQGAYIAALVVGAIGMIGGALRCFSGLGIF
jgi:hypothetical protein